MSDISSAHGPPPSGHTSVCRHVDRGQRRKARLSPIVGRDAELTPVQRLPRTYDGQLPFLG